MSWWRRLIDVRSVLAAIGLVAAGLFFFEAQADDERVRDGDLSERLQDFLSDQINASRIPGAAVAVVEGDRTIYAGGFGKNGDGSRITPDTPFWIGSNGKSFTALAVMQLAEAGQIDIEAPVQRYLPEFRVRDENASSRITVRHLLNQTSGLSRADGIRAVLNEEKQSLEATVAEMRNLRLNRPVGESFEYSNLNFVLAGLIVERISGQSWGEYVESRIFEPLGMRNSYASLEEAAAAGLADTYRYFFGFALRTEGVYLPGLAPTGYIYSSASDMARYLLMYLQGGKIEGGSIVTQASVDAMLRGETNETSRQLQSHSFDFRYGRGWFVGPFGVAEDARWHLGNLPQFTAWMVLLPETGHGIVVLLSAGSQMELAGANSVMSRIPIGVVNIVRGEDPPSGPSITRFYILFDAAVAAVLVLQVWSLLRVFRRRPSFPSGGRARAVAAAPLAWELGLATLLLVLFPSVIGAGWAASIRALPDLSLVIAAIAALWLLTGIARLTRLWQARPGTSGTPDTRLRTPEPG